MTREIRPRAFTSEDALRLLGIYYLLTGAWPVVHIGSFMALTGRKRDTWLVKAVGAVLAVLGARYLSETRRGEERRRATELTAASVALTLAAADAWYVARGRISPIYLADAAVQLAVAAALVSKTETGLR